jgi:CP family cyanate transporter-like MFS transporter
VPGPVRPAAPILARRFGAERVVLGILLTLAGGIVLRSSLGEWGLFGSLVAGASIGIIGVLLPGIVKRDFAAGRGHDRGLHHGPVPGRGAGGGFHGAAEHAFGDSWPIGRLLDAAGAGGGAVLVAPGREKHGAHQVAYRVKGLLRDPLAWQVTLYMGLQSSWRTSCSAGCRRS